MPPVEGADCPPFWFAFWLLFRPERPGTGELVESAGTGEAGVRPPEPAAGAAVCAEGLVAPTAPPLLMEGMLCA